MGFPLLAEFKKQKMITGAIRAQVDAIWKAFWSGGIANPLEVLEQITYLIFIRRLDDACAMETSRASRLDERARLDRDSEFDTQRLRWSSFKDLPPDEMFKVVGERVFPFIRGLGRAGSSYEHYMKDARFSIPSPYLLAKVVNMLDRLPMEGDTKGDIYEYMLVKIAAAGHNGQFRSPRHVIELMVALTQPTPADVICDPASGTCGFLVGAAEYLKEHHAGLFSHNERARAHFHREMFHGFDFDSTMLRIGSMNMLLHGVEAPNVLYKNSLGAGNAQEEGKYSLVLANPPFAGTVDHANTAENLLNVARTRKTELLFLALCVRLLKVGGRAAVIVPSGILSGASSAHRAMRQLLVEEQKLEGVISLPAGTFRPYTGISTAILLFSRTDCGGTDHVWFYNVQADGWSLDNRRQPLLSDDRLGPRPAQALSDAEYAKNNLPDVLDRWGQREGRERCRPRTAQSFCVSRVDIARQDYELSINRYQTLSGEPEDAESTVDILARLKQLENEIRVAMDELEGMLK